MTEASSAPSPSVAAPASLSLAAQLEALLFVASEPLTIERLAEGVGRPLPEVEAALAELETQLASGGLRLQRLGRRVQLVTAPQAAPLVERFLALEVTLRLSQPALETLAIIAYAQPITRPQLEAIRGVNSDSVLRTLVAAGLVEEVGRAESVGRPLLYGTTFQFLQQFGLQSLAELPPLESKPPDQPAPA